MGREFSAKFAVRYDECGAGGDLRPSAYLCYTQEVATLDARDIGWAGNPWVIRRTRLILHQPVRYPASLTVTTRAIGFARSLAQRTYSFSNGDGQQVAEAQSLWVSLDRATLRPARIPTELAALWFPTGDAPAPPTWPDWPPTPVQPSQRSNVQIGFSLLDGQQHVNNARYLDLLDDAGWQALTAETDFGPVGAGGNLSPSVYDVEYYTPAGFDEQLSIDTWFIDHRDSQLSRLQEVRRDQQLIARSHSIWQWRDESGAARNLPPAPLAGDR